MSNRLPCAKCVGSLESYSTSGTVIERCPSCLGLFFERGELVRLLTDANLESVRGEDARRGGAIPHAAADSMTARCPRCRVPMGRLEAGTGEGFAYDLCPSCNSLWLDHGELAFLEGANRHVQGRAPGSPEDAKRRAVELLAEIEAQVEFVEKQKRARLGRLDRMMQFGLTDTKEILRIKDAIEAEAEVARRAVEGSRLFGEVRALTQQGILSPTDFEALRRRLGTRP